MMRLSFFFILLILKQLSFSQLSGTRTIPSTYYPSIKVAIDSLNLYSVGTGGITFNVNAGHTESVTAPLTITASGTSSKPIVFQKNGAGDNPSITRTDAGSLSTATFGGAGDAVIRLEGTDFITFNGININANLPTIEYGYLTNKPNGTNGCHSVTIANSTITLYKYGSAYIIGIYISNGPTATNNPYGVTVTQESGINSEITLTGNTIQSVHAGISFWGCYSYHDRNIMIGSPDSGNVIQNFGGDSIAGTFAASYGVFCRYVNNPTVSYNIIDNAAAGGKEHKSGLFGIFFQDVSGDVVGNHNSITLSKDVLVTTTEYIYNRSTVTSNTFNYNTFAAGPLASNGPFILIDAASNTPNITVTGNQTSGAIIRGDNATYCYFNNGEPSGGTEIITDNNFSNITVMTGSSGFGGIVSSLPTTMQNRIWSNNTISNISNNGTGQTIAMDLSGTQDNQVYGNHIHSISGNATLYAIYTYCVYPVNNSRIHSNTIYNLSTSGTSIAGIFCQGFDTTYCYDNNINNLTSSAIAPIVSGIIIQRGSANYCYNNFVSSLKAPISSSDNSIRGIAIGSQTNYSISGIYNNSIYLDATSRNAGFGSTGIFHVYYVSPTSNLLDMRNNVVVNNSIPNGTGRTVAFRRSAATDLNNYGTTSNCNTLYAGTSGPNNLIYYDGTNADQTIEAFKARVFPREAASFSENPPFINVSASPYDLHLQTATPTQCESAGIPIMEPFNITTDYDGDTRSSLIPDIGADEFTGIILDLSPPMISLIPLGNTTNTEERILSSVISDVSGVPTSGPGLPMLYWNISGGSYTGVQAYYINGNHYYFAFGEGVATGDIVRYYIVAQDELSPTPNVGTSPYGGASGFTTNPPACSTPPAIPYSYTIVTPFSGTYTVGTGGNYPNLTGAGGLFAYINQNIVTGNVNVNILSDLIEDGAIALNQFQEDPPDSNFELTIQPSSATPVTISGSYAGGLIRLNGADRVTFDGRSEGEGNYLNFINSGTSGAVFQLISIGHNAGATNNTIRNCNVSMGGNAYGTYGIVFGGATVGSTGPDNDDNTIRNNSISKAYTGIWAQGLSSSNPGVMDNLQILENSIGSSDVNSYVAVNGIVVAYGTGGKITQNTIYNINSPINAPIGLTLADGFISATISRNKIYNIVFSGTGSWGARGIFIKTNFPSSNLTIDNNLIYNVCGNGGPGFNELVTIAGMCFDGTTGGLKIYYNSVYMSGNFAYTNATATVAILFRDSRITDIDLRNNIFQNSMDNTLQNTDKHYAITCLAPAESFSFINQNDYFTTGAEGILGRIGGADRTTLASWQSATGKDAGSISADPLFVSTTDLQLQLGSPSIGEATPLTPVSYDFGGNPRHLSKPTIGAYEYSPINQYVVWTGLADDNWNTAGNWSPEGIPAADDDVWIPEDPASNPDIFPRIPNGLVVNCHEIYLEPSAVVIIEPGGTLNIGNTNP